jgi:predicted ATP-grasp superfamily ATP-dependent carboligase
MRPLILLGASVRAAAFSALRAGFSPYAIDLFADRDLAAACPAVKVAHYPRDLFAALHGAPEAPWIYTGGLENYPRLVDQMAAIRPLLGNRGDVLRNIRDPEQVSLAARDAGLAFPEMKQGGVTSGAWLVKPRRGSGGLGVRLATPAELVRPPRGAYLQRYIEGEAASAVFVAARGQAMLLGATRQLLGRDFGLASPFLYAGSIGPLGLRDEESAGLQTLGNCLAARFGLVGLFNVDFVRTESERCVVEVNPRYSASIEVLERVTGIDSIGLHAAACERGEFVSPQEQVVNRFAGKAIVYAAQAGVIPEAFEQFVERWNCSGPWPGIADLPRVGDPAHAGHPLVTVFAESDSLIGLETELRQRVSAISRVLSTKY